MTVQIVHIGDLHFGGLADVPVVEALERMLPDLRPDAIVIGGDLSQRARHGEFQRARAFANLCRETAPVLVIPGNHDVQWWRRPFVPFGKDAVYQKYRSYFGPELAPTLTIPGGAVIASALTAHGVAWGSLTVRVRDIAVKGHLPKREAGRVQDVFAKAEAGLPRVLVIHHNLMRGEMSKRMGLARWRRAQRRIIEAGTDVVLCGHDHQESAEQLEGKVTVSTAGTLSTRARGGQPVSFNFVTIDPAAVQITFFRWDAPKQRFQPSDTAAFARSQSIAKQSSSQPVPAAQE
jgi:3',5'-cyclic AMP phosphodiesterase CpdA